MFSNYFTIAFRQLRKQKMYSVIKIGGFALSIAACILIALFIRHELSYDSNNSDGDRVYRVIGALRRDGKLLRNTSFPAPMARTIAADFPEIEKAGRLMPNQLFGGAGSNQIRPADTKENSYEEGFCFADQEIIDILHIPIIKGNPAKVLDEPFTLLISRSKAEKFFPGQDPIGKLMVFNDRERLLIRISGVMEDFPDNSHLQYDYFISLKGNAFWEGEQDEWMASNYDTYVKLKPGSDAKGLEKKLTADVLDNYIIPKMKAANYSLYKDLKKNAWLELQPLRDIHLKSQDIDDSLSHGDSRFVWLFGSVALFVLLLACVNFINLSTAKSANRAREVGLRKTIGSLRIHLVQQFLAESILYSIIGFVLAILVTWLLLPYFNQLSQKDLDIPWTSAWFLPVIFLSALIVGVLAGLYPAFYLSSFRPVNVLKGDLSRGSRNSLLRNVLVVFQFTCSIVLIIGTVVIYQQTNFLLNRKVGFDKDRVVVVQGTNTMGDKIGAFKNELQKQQVVQSVSISDYLPVTNTKRNMNTFWVAEKRQEGMGTPSQFWVVDHDYLPTMGMKLVAGRNFRADLPTDSQAVIINQRLAVQMGLKDPLGVKLTNGNNYTVIGVVEDFNFETMRQDIGGLMFSLGRSPSSVAVKVKTGNMQEAMATIGRIWKDFMPNQQIRYAYLDSNFEQMYADVQRMQRIFSSFSLLAILIACLGLFALAAFMAEQRHKEISIRKVLGASVAQINGLLSADFLKLVLLAVLIASPIAWFGMNRWLQDFAYRISISWWMFGAAAIIVLLIALVTISFQSLKAALNNPIEGLRSE